MSENTELFDAVIEAAVEMDGRKKLSCAKAFRLAERFGAELPEIGRVCNDHKIRITKCQLGCFK
jgi:hypothetical protein